jgi:NADP-dependent 3-hydroxy acid dehydrogenase YdfG
MSFVMSNRMSMTVGEATARALAAGGYRLALLARRADRIQALADELGKRRDRDRGRRHRPRLEMSITAEDIAEVIAFAVSRPRRMTLNEILIRPTGQAL